MHQHHTAALWLPTGALEDDALLEALVLLGALAGQPEFDVGVAESGLVSYTSLAVECQARQGGRRGKGSGQDLLTKRQTVNTEQGNRTKSKSGIVSLKVLPLRGCLLHGVPSFPLRQHGMLCVPDCRPCCTLHCVALTAAGAPGGAHHP